jgi:hypothetical protein
MSQLGIGMIGSMMNYYIKLISEKLPAYQGQDKKELETRFERLNRDWLVLRRALSY